MTASVLLLASLAPPARADDGPRPAEGAPPLRFSLTEWGVAEGLPATQVNATTQDADGSLWIATLAGLVHFDGFSFEVFDETNSTLPSSRLTVVSRTPSGRLWIGTEQGQLLENRDGSFHQLEVPEYSGGRIATLAEDASGTVWVSRYGDPARPDRALVWQLVGNRLVARKDLDPLWIAPDGQGGSLVVTHEGGLRPLALRSMVVALSVDETGAVWGQMPHGRLVRLADGAFDPVGEPVPAAGELHRALATRLADGWLEVFSTAGARVGAVPASHWQVLWLVDRRGLIWTTRDERRLEAFRPDEAEPIASFDLGSYVRDVTEDREGNLWVGTLTRGLLRISETPVESFGPETGMPIPAAVGLLPDGALVIEPGPVMPYQPLLRFVPGRLEPIAGARGWLLWDSNGVRWTFETDAVMGSGPAGEVRLAATDPSWLVEDPGLPGVLWLVEPHQLRRIDTRGGGGPVVTGRWQIAANRALATDGHEGAWVGSQEGLWHLVGDRVEHSTRAEGLPVDNVRAVLPDGRGGLWLGTYGGGLVHFDGEAFESLGAARGLPETVVSSLLIDHRGDLWFAGNRGIYRIRRRSLEQALADRSARLDVLAFGPAEGLANPETTGRPAVMTRDGRLWFGTFGGLVAIDPEVIARREAYPPLVSLGEVESAGGLHPPGPGFEVAPTARRDLAFSFTASHLTAPQTLAFRHRLEPLDTEWVDSGVERLVRYRNLDPGSYRFRLQARHSDGVWVDAAQDQPVTILPRFRETRAFLWLLAGAALVVLGLAWQLATRQVRRRAGQLARAVEMRTAELAAERDVVARQAERLGELAEARAQFMAAVSHELRTPLTLILGPLGDLRDGRLGTLPEAAREEVETTLTSADRLRRLVDRLLGVARAESELTRLHCREGDLVAFVEGLVTELRPLAQRGGSSLVCAVPSGELMAWFDPLQLETVVINLVANAIKHTPAGSSVEVQLQRDESGEWAVLAVRDDGPGISADEVEHLFERFYRGRTAAADPRGGFGLGLALVREVVERHGGSIDVTSSPQGTVFTVRLRIGRDHLAEEDCAAFDAGGVPQRRPTLALSEDLAWRSAPEETGSLATSAAEAVAEETLEDRTTVLVVDDNADLRRLVRRQLEPAYRVLEAADGEQALANLAEQLPDLVLSDVMMPGLDGLALCRAIRADPEIAFLPVVLLTAKASTDSQVEGLEVGVDAYLAKPFHGDVLRATVENLIASRHRLRDLYAAAAGRGEPVASEGPLAGQGATELAAEDRRYLERLQAAVEAHLHDEEFAVEQLARLVHQSRVSLYRHVKRLLETTPSDVIREARLARARRLLDDREGSVAEVAYAVGFKSTAHFSNSFRERFGTRPSAWADRGSRAPST